MKKVLMLGVASAQMDAIIELKKMGIKTYACAQADDGPGSKYADHFELINFVEEEKLAQFIEKEEIDCVYSVGSDLAMPICSAISERKGLPYFVSSEIAQICNNKNKMREFLGKDFIGSIRYQVLENINTEILLDYPFIMKPSDSQGQRGVGLINNYNEFLKNFNICKQYSRSGMVIIEEYINGPELSLNVYVIDGKVVFMTASDRVVWPQFNGGVIHKHIVPSRILNKETNINIKDLVLRTIKKLGIKNGPLYFQIKIRNDEPYIIEVTPRLDGCHMWMLLKYYTGINLIKLIFEHLLFGEIHELKNYKKSDLEYTLEFLCETPNREADYSKFSIPQNSLVGFRYYDDGDIIRPINGHFEKIGYVITKN